MGRDNGGICNTQEKERSRCSQNRGGMIQRSISDDDGAVFSYLSDFFQSQWKIGSWYRCQMNCHHLHH